jgi:hypothetical protein
MKQLFTLTFLWFLFSSLPSNAQFSLTVGNPKISQTVQQGTIEEATLSIRPKGVYWEYGLYLTFSSRGTTYDADDSLEIKLKFELPENAIVHDSWLWINDNIFQAKILDKWTATEVYEGIVNRRQDPSILYKIDAKKYELRVFPLVGDQTRKVKITFLMPTDWSASKVWAGIPTNILNTSKNKLPEFDLLVWPGLDWENPILVKQILNSTNVTLEQAIDTQNEVFYKTKVPNVLFNTDLLLRFDSPMKDGRYLSTSSDSLDGMYQLAIIPQTEVSALKVKKIALLFDYDKFGGSVADSVALTYTKIQLMSNLRPVDSFNVFYTDTIIKKASSQWLPATQSNLQAAIFGLKPVGTSKLGELLKDGIQFCQNNGNDGTILLLSNAAQYCSKADATVMYDSLIDLMGNVQPEIHVVDYRTNSSPNAFIGGITYTGNEYLYFRLAQTTSGSANYVRYNTIQKITTFGFESAYYTPIENFDFYTTVENGFCYARYFVNNVASRYANKPILQIGRYHGSFPFHVEMTGQLNGNGFLTNDQIPQSEFFKNERLLPKMWSGKQIQELESYPNSNNIIFDIVQNSLEARVLSKYTAFLCLEDSASFCDDCLDETQFTSTNNPNVSPDSLVTAFPNPFSDNVLISVNIDQLKSKTSRTYLEIYNLSGQLVRHFESPASNSAGPINYRWDGTNTLGASVPAGVYILMVKSGEWSQVLKLVKQ